MNFDLFKFYISTGFSSRVTYGYVGNASTVPFFDYYQKPCAAYRCWFANSKQACRNSYLSERSIIL